MRSSRKVELGCCERRGALAVVEWRRAGRLRGARRAGGVAGGPGPLLGQAGGVGSAFEAAERNREVVGPGPVVLEAQRCGAGVEGEAAGDVQQPVAQSLGLATGEFARQQQSWVQAIRSCAILTISSQTRLRSKSRNGMLRTPVSLSLRS